jgi:hypothetical protein
MKQLSEWRNAVEKFSEAQDLLDEKTEALLYKFAFILKTVYK